MIPTMRGRDTLAASAVFLVLITLMMWPQVRHIADSAVEHQDVYFNMWRLHWFAHALTSSPARLLDGNIFYPEPRTLTYSDAMVVEGVIAAPLIWIGIPPVLLHNLMILGAIVASAAGLFALVRYLTASRGAALLAGAIFALAPYRHEHIMHMELQWTMWMPLAFLALHRALDTGGLRHGLATGAAVALQMLSSIYYGIFLATLIAPCALLLMVRDQGTTFRRAIRPLAAGGALALVICGLYALPYLRTRDVLGERPGPEVSTFSARPVSYLVATPTNWLYGDVLARRGRPERRLFPGALAALLATIGLLLRVPSRRQLVYVIALVAAFEMSLGFNGYLYSFLHEHVSAYRGLRAPARLGVFVLMFLAVLAGYGYRALAESLGRMPRRLLAGVLLAGMLTEYAAAMPLVTYPNKAPAVYRVLAQQPYGVVAEFPIPREIPGRDAEYSFMSIFHWKPLVNGYSGMFPRSYLERLARLLSFPHRTAIAQLRRDGVRYVVVHSTSYTTGEFLDIRTSLTAQGLAELGVFDDAEGPAALYQLQ